MCKPWLRALSTLSTRATTPPEPGTVTKWKCQLESMVMALPCLQQITIGSKLSAVGAQQLSVLAAADQLRTLNIPQGHALQDRSLMVSHMDQHVVAAAQQQVLHEAECAVSKLAGLCQ